jgi:hypothetical protein
MPGKLACWSHGWRQCSSLCFISRVLFALNSFFKVRQSTALIMWKYWSDYMKLCIERILNFGPVIWFPPSQCPSSEGSLCRAFSVWSQLLKWNTHPIPLIWLQMISGCFPKVKSALKGQRFQDIEKNWKNVTSALKAVSQQEFRNVSNSGSIIGQSA